MMKKALRLAREIAKKTGRSKRKAILKWCAEAKRMLS